MQKMIAHCPKCGRVMPFFLDYEHGLPGAYRKCVFCGYDTREITFTASNKTVHGKKEDEDD